MSYSKCEFSALDFDSGNICKHVLPESGIRGAIKLIAQNAREYAVPGVCTRNTTFQCIAFPQFLPVFGYIFQSNTK